MTADNYNLTHIINGKPYDATGAKTREVLNPATRQPITTHPIATREVLDEAVAAARKAFPGWAATPWEERKKALLAWADSFEAMAEQLVNVLSTEQGKTLGGARHEVYGCPVWIREMAKYELKDTVLSEDDDQKTIQVYKPIGVCAGIVPWNFPILLMTWKIIPSLLTGNVIIIKPSPFTPIGDFLLVKDAQKFFPPGVLQIVLGDDNLGPWITSHPGIDKVSFTGSTATGKLVAKSCSDTLKRVTLELGGNDACVVTKDVDIPSVARQVIAAALTNSGQICVATKRIYVHEDIYDAFKNEVAAAIPEFKVNYGDDNEAFAGPLNNEPQFNRVKNILADIKQNGQKIICGGDVDPNAKGYHIPLTVVDNPPEESRIVQEEQFGPVMPLLKWKDEEDVIKRVNDTPYGLASTLFGRNLEEVERIGRRIEAGSVWINKVMPFSPHTPFGGHKNSGVGVENGLDGIKLYTYTQIIVLGKK
ncbi:aldehyde dehydrogenase [Violaceomyces palustris]|uniref:Aldehyde dehydrogenase n=1 Tax=Violaceomyces palustris TaxID=1673888 RepID=A0ACD0NNC6_9BASI|nr:aldehyde dehydrogenase [Violaceomyces palustris]